MRSSAPSPDIANEFQAQDTSGVLLKCFDVESAGVDMLAYALK